MLANWSKQKLQTRLHNSFPGFRTSVIATIFRSIGLFSYEVDMYLTCESHTEWKIIIPTTRRDTTDSTTKQRGIDSMWQWRRLGNHRRITITIELLRRGFLGLHTLHAVATILTSEQVYTSCLPVLWSGRYRLGFPLQFWDEPSSRDRRRQNTFLLHAWFSSNFMVICHPWQRRCHPPGDFFGLLSTSASAGEDCN